jgi:hypothetical protein
LHIVKTLKHIKSLLKNRFTTIEYGDGKSAHQVGGEVRDFPDGAEISAIAYSDGTVFYTKATDPKGFYIKMLGGTLTTCHPEDY